MPKLDLTDLRLFLCVIESGSITHGAAHANLALASASERLRNMEQGVGLALLERHPRGVVATEAGEALAHHARLMLRQHALLQSELKGFSGGMQGTLHFYANTAALTSFLPQRLAGWLAERPGLRLELKERTSVDIVRAVASGRVEAGMVSDAIEAPGLQRQAVAKDPLVLIVPAGHRLAAHRAARWTDVLDAPFVGLAPGSALQEHLDDQARAAGGALRLRVRMKTFEGVGEMVAHGVGLGVLPQELARRHQRRYGYRLIALREAWAQRQLCLCFRQWQVLSPAMRNLLAHLGAQAALASG